MQLVEARNAKAHSVASSSCLELRLAFGGVILDKLRADSFCLPPGAPCRWPTRCATLDATRSAAVEAALRTAWCHSVWTGTGRRGRSQGSSASMMYIARAGRTPCVSSPTPPRPPPTPQVAWVVLFSAAMWPGSSDLLHRVCLAVEISSTPTMNSTG